MARVLIADDDPTSRSYLASIVSQLHHEVLEARDGEEALQRLRASGCDLALLDVMMPKRNGLDVVRALRQDPHLAELPVVVVTAMTREGDRDWALKQGADEVLTKPISAAALRQIVERYLKSG